MAAPDIDVEPRYTIRCEECGVVETTGNRAYANDVRRQHRVEHSEVQKYQQVVRPGETYELTMEDAHTARAENAHRPIA